MNCVTDIKQAKARPARGFECLARFMRISRGRVMHHRSSCASRRSQPHVCTTDIAECMMLKREGWPDNHKRVYRLYQAEGRALRLKRPKRNKSAKLRQPKQLVTAMNQIWSMDFVADALFDGRRLRALTVVDNYTRESLAIDVGQSLKGDDVVNTLNRIAAYRGLPTTIKVDNGSEFISKVMDKWAYEHGVELDFSRPGKPTDNAKVESFNGRFRQECLNAHWFLSLTAAKTKIEEWRQYYNEARPHSALQWACSGQVIPDTVLSFSSATAGANPLLNCRGRCQLYQCIR